MTVAGEVADEGPFVVYLADERAFVAAQRKGLRRYRPDERAFVGYPVFLKPAAIPLIVTTITSRKA